MRWRIIGFAGAGLALAVSAIGPTGAEEPAWDALRGGGQVVLIRHASTVASLGDPPGFRLDDCATQHHLSEAGRAEARRIGAPIKVISEACLFADKEKVAGCQIAERARAG
jgi:hypothetical protein